MMCLGNYDRRAGGLFRDRGPKEKWAGEAGLRCPPEPSLPKVKELPPSGWVGRGFGVFVKGSGWQLAFPRAFSWRPPYTSSVHEKALIPMFSFCFRPSGVANGNNNRA